MCYFSCKVKKIISFALISHNDLQTSISYMASSRKIGRLYAEMAPSCFKLANDQSTPDTCFQIFLLSCVLYFWWSLIIVELD